MGALQDRLVFTLQDVRQCLKLPLTYTEVTVEVIIEPLAGVIPDNTIFSVLIDTTKVVYDAGASPTPLTVVAGLVSAITTAAIADIIAVDNLDETYTITSATPDRLIFFSPLQAPQPSTPDEYLYDSLIQVALSMADEYLCNEFADLNPCTGEVIAGTEQAIPVPVKAGVCQLYAWLVAEQNKNAVAAGTGGTAGNSGPVKSHKVGDESVTFATGRDINEDFAQAITNFAQLPFIVTAILELYRLHPGYAVRRTPLPRRSGLGDMGPNGNSNGNILVDGLDSDCAC